MKIEYTSAKQVMGVTLMPSLQERISRINAIQKRTAIRNKRLLKGVWNAKEAIDRSEVLRAATRWNALNLGKGDVLGSIENGKWADLIVVDQDYMTVPIEKIPDTRVLMTLVGGRIVYEQAGLK